MALALPADGVLVACDISEEYANIGKPFWKQVSFFIVSFLSQILKSVSFLTFNTVWSEITIVNEAAIARLTTHSTSLSLIF